jgi:hypothetical protein
MSYEVFDAENQQGEVPPSRCPECAVVRPRRPATTTWGPPPVARPLVPSTAAHAVASTHAALIKAQLEDREGRRRHEVALLRAGAAVPLALIRAGTFVVVVVIIAYAVMQIMGVGA